RRQFDVAVARHRRATAVHVPHDRARAHHAGRAVEAGKANSHKGRGWEVFTDHIIKSLNHTSQPIVFLLWGSQAKAKSSLINNPKHTILSAPHPSPLSAHRGFFGSHHFSKTNQILVENHQTPIEWV
ncbi:MAG: hypothetical protein OQJ95_07060, partial [Kangiella sp.]|nr:hypothetical protein [Kangiella sp.]